MGEVILKHDIDPKKKLKSEVGNISDIEIFNNQILVAVYIRPEKTRGGVFMPTSHTEEDKYQSKVGLVLKKGATAFVDEAENWFKDVDISLDDWVVFRPSDGWPLIINGVMCRVICDTEIKGRVGHPDKVK
jgi:co-chaperonin GroES (HSP10)